MTSLGRNALNIPIKENFKMKKKFVVFLLVAILSTPAYAAWKFNPFTGKQDYYEAGTAVTAYTVATLPAAPSDGDIAVSTQGYGLILKATNGANCYRITVDNNGLLSTTQVSCP